MNTTNCPFCGSADISHAEVTTVNDVNHFVVQSECQGCGALGPKVECKDELMMHNDEELTRNAWNGRYTPRCPGCGMTELCGACAHDGVTLL